LAVLLKRPRIEQPVHPVAYGQLALFDLTPDAKLASHIECAAPPFIEFRQAI
jgi:hypothetical protein